MRALKRLNKPAILNSKEQIWLDKILLTPDKRPGTNTYRHKEILEALLTTSYHKCFYCETLLKGVASEVDHHVEYNIDPCLSVTWENLYLACVSCNDKVNHREIPITEALDPCRNSDIEIQEHIYFENEVILPKSYSVLGSKTIKKYKLGSKNAEYLRMKELKKFNDVFQSISLKCIKEVRKPLPNETQKLKSFTLIEKSYSLMFIQKLAEIDL